VCTRFLYELYSSCPHSLLSTSAVDLACFWTSEKVFPRHSKFLSRCSNSFLNSSAAVPQPRMTVTLLTYKNKSCRGVNIPPCVRAAIHQWERGDRSHPYLSLSVVIPWMLGNLGVWMVCKPGDECLSKLPVLVYNILTYYTLYNVHTPIHIYLSPEGALQPLGCDSTRICRNNGCAKMYVAHTAFPSSSAPLTLHVPLIFL